jgi:hypothetical protein
MMNCEAGSTFNLLIPRLVLRERVAVIVTFELAQELE